MLTGYTANLPIDALVNMGILGREVAGVFTKFGVTTGGTTFDPGVELKDITFDGARCRLKGLTRRVGFKPVLKGKFKELGPTASGNQIAVLEPGSVEAVPDGSGTKVVTPKAAGTLHVAGDYLTDVRWLLERAGGGYAAVHFPIALVTKWTLASKDKEEGEIDFELEAVGDPAVDLGVAPYLIEIRTAQPT